MTLKNKQKTRRLKRYVRKQIKKQSDIMMKCFEEMKEYVDFKVGQKQ